MMRLRVWALALVQTLGYGLLFYPFIALNEAWQADLGWSNTQIQLGLTCGLVAQALLAPLAGHWLDRGSARQLIVGGMALGSMLLLMLSQVKSLPLFYMGWAVMGLAWSLSLYEVTFAYLIRVFGPHARPRITTVTLFAGFASTLSYPFNRWMAADWSWEAALVAQGCLGLVLMVPLAWFATGMREQAAVDTEPQSKPQAERPPRTQGSWLPLLFLAAAFSIFGAVHNGLLANFFPMMTAFGVTAGTATALSTLTGPMQVLGRAALMLARPQVRMIHVTYACVAGMGLSLLFLWSASLGVLAGSLLIAAVAAFLVFNGASNGVESIARPLTIAETLGRARIGAFSGVVALPAGLSLALVPALVAWGAAQLGYAAVLLILIAAMGLALLGFVLSQRGRHV